MTSSSDSRDSSASCLTVTLSIDADKSMPSQDTLSVVTQHVPSDQSQVQGKEHFTGMVIKTEPEDAYEPEEAKHGIGQVTSDSPARSHDQQAEWTYQIKYEDDSHSGVDAGQTPELPDNTLQRIEALPNIADSENENPVTTNLTGSEKSAIVKTPCKCHMCHKILRINGRIQWTLANQVDSPVICDRCQEVGHKDGPPEVHWSDNETKRAKEDKISEASNGMSNTPLHRRQNTDNRVDAEALRLLDINVLRNLIPKVGPRLKFLKAFNAFQADPNSLADSPVDVEALFRHLDMNFIRDLIPKAGPRVMFLKAYRAFHADPKARADNQVDEAFRLLDMDVVFDLLPEVGPRLEFLEAFKNFQADNKTGEVARTGRWMTPGGGHGMPEKDMETCMSISGDSVHHLPPHETVDQPPLKKPMRCKFDIHQILQKSQKGSALLEQIEVKKVLSPGDLQDICHILVAHLMDMYGPNPPTLIKDCLGESLVEHFPFLKDKEGKTGYEAWFVKGKNGRAATGCLEARLRYLRMRNKNE